MLVVNRSRPLFTTTEPRIKSIKVDRQHDTKLLLLSVWFISAKWWIRQQTAQKSAWKWTETHLFSRSWYDFSPHQSSVDHFHIGSNKLYQQANCSYVCFNLTKCIRCKSQLVCYLDCLRSNKLSLLDCQLCIRNSAFHLWKYLLNKQL